MGAPEPIVLTEAECEALLDQLYRGYLPNTDKGMTISGLLSRLKDRDMRAR